MSRGRLWDDVFTRTLASLLTLSIVGLLAVLGAVIHPNRTVFLIVGTFLTTMAILIHSTMYDNKWIRRTGNVAPLKQRLAMGLVAGLITALMLVAIIVWVPE